MWEPPHPGTTIRVLLRGRPEQHGVWAEVIQRQQRGAVAGLLCETVDTPHRLAFWFSPLLVGQGADPTVASWEPADEPTEVEEFRRSEVERLHRALQQDGRTIASLDSQVRRIPGFNTSPSQIRIKAVVLDLGAPQEERDRIECEVEDLMGTGVISEHVSRFVRRRGGGFEAAAELAHFISFLAQRRVDFQEVLQNLRNRSIIDLRDYNEYKLLAEFSCSACDRRWKSGLAWGVYSSSGRATCNCLTNPLPGRESYTTQRHLDRNGCVHVFRDRDDCDVRDMEVEEPVTKDDMDLDDPPAQVQLRLPVKLRQALVPRAGAGPPKQGCGRCRRMCPAIYCQANGKRLKKPHKPKLCPKCIRLGSFCHGSTHKADIVMRYNVVVSLLDDSVVWRRSEAGLEAVIRHEGAEVLLQLRPWLFVVPDHRDELFTTTGREAKVLRPDRQPAGADEFKMFMRMLRAVMAPTGHIDSLSFPEAMPWPAVPSQDETLHALHDFLEDRLGITITYQAIEGAANAAWKALQEHNEGSLEAALAACGLAIAAQGASAARPADQFRAWLRLYFPHEAASRGTPRLNRANTAARLATGAGAVLEAFVSASRCMGGRMIGTWRAYSFNGCLEYGERHGVRYWKPQGWTKRRVQVANFEECRSWPIVYHGTSQKSAGRILITELRRVGQRGVQKAHGGAGAAPGGTIYLSPSIYYASHPVYAPLMEIEPGRWFQIVLQCKVRPGSWREQFATLVSRHWPPKLRFDPNLPTNDNLEYLIDDENDVTVIGVMYRELGSGVDPNLYGELVTRLRPEDVTDGPEYLWTKILAEHHRQRGLYVQTAAAAA